MKMNSQVNAQSGQVGFFIALLMSALLVVAGSVAINTTESTRRSASETQGSQLLNIGEGGLDFLQAGQANSVIEGLNLDELNRNFVAQPDQGVVYELNQGDTLELNPSIHTPCQLSSCVIKIWWNNLGSPSADSCDGQAALLVSEFSQDARDANQTICSGQTMATLCPGSDPACLEFFAACQAPADNAGSIDPRTGLSRERARFYLFRPAICAFDTTSAASRDWAGYETALGNPVLSEVYRAATGIGTRTGILGIADPDGVGQVTRVNKDFAHFSSNPVLTEQFANYYEIPIFPNTTIVRIKPLFANTQVLIDMPGQIMQGVSTASDGNQTRTIQIKQTLPSVPGIMDYALFVGGGSIDKRASIDRDTLP